MAWKGYHFRVTKLNNSYPARFYNAVKTFLEAQGWELHDSLGNATKARWYLSGYNYAQDNGKFTIDGKTYTFKTTLTPTEGEVLIGANIAESFDNVKLAINRTDPGNNDGVKYSIAAANPNWEATLNTDNAQYIEWRTAGNCAGNIPTLSVADQSWFGWSGIETWGCDEDTVWKSNGESGNEPYGYVHLQPKPAQLWVVPYQYWDEAAHTGTRRLNYSLEPLLDAWDTTYDCLIAGDKDLIYLGSHIAVNYPYSRSGVLFGHIPKRLYPDLIQTTDNIEAGNNVSIPVTDSSKVPGAGGYFQILGLSEGCDRLQVVSLPDSTHIVVANLPRNYASGATIGQPASTYFMSQWACNNGDQGCRCMSYCTDAGLTVTQNVHSPNAFNLTGESSFSGRRMMTPWYFLPNAGPLIGYIDKGIYYFPYPANMDACCMNNDLSLETVNILATSATGTSITDNTKEWTPDEFIGKFIVLVGGTGIGQVRKITDNDDTTITIGYPWYLNPDGTTTFRIYDTVYRYLPNFPFNSGSAHLITHTEMPE